MRDSFNRKINYLRISVTDRCNFRCQYCMPAEGIQLIKHEDILRFEEIIEVVKIGVGLGITKVRLTGGEPLVRKGIVDFVAMLSEIKGITDIGMTTNGVYLERYASKLAKAGLKRVNVSLDTTDPKYFKEITRGGDIQSVFRGLKAAGEAGLLPIKLNCVIRKSRFEEHAVKVARFAEENNYQVRYIKWMNLDSGEFSVVDGGEGGNCKICNRLRLTANGKIKPCLFSELEYDVRELGIREAYLQAVNDKPRSGTSNSVGTFYNIGG